MFVKPLYDKNEFDVFLGKGWTNWIRVRAIPKYKTVEVINKSEEVTTITDKLKQLIFFKTRNVEGV